MSDTAQNISSLTQKIKSDASSGGQVVLDPTPQVVSQPVVDPVDVSLNELDNVISELENTVPHGVVNAIDQATNTLNPSNPARSAKERIESSSTPDTAGIDLGGGVQTIEHEKVPEIPVEVESFLQRVDDHADQAPHEIVIADGSTGSSETHYPTTPVVVLPISHQEEREGEKKSPKQSYRWLVEWSHKIVKMFVGKVIYKEDK